MLLPSLRAPDDPLANDFKNFLYVVFMHLRGLPPTKAQYAMADFLQWGWSAYGEEVTDGRTDIVEGQRGLGKSEITAAFALWRLYRNPVDEKILVASASGGKAGEFVHQAKEILMTLPVLSEMRPRPDQRNRFDRFDVNGASQSQSPSLKAAGIFGQITGSRASCIIADDIETLETAGTEENRAKLIKKSNEFEHIKLPKIGDIIYLGTPQTEESIYIRKVKEQGYRIWAHPARYPERSKLEHYQIERTDGTVVSTLAPHLLEAIETAPEDAIWYANGKGKPTDPERFPEEVLLERESRGQLEWLLQYMLDTSVSDEERYPLKQRDLMVMALNPTTAPRVVQWGRHSDGKNRRADIPNHGFTGDYWQEPLFMSKSDDWSKYDQIIGYVDTSGGGADETSWGVVATLNGLFYVLLIRGMTAAEARKIGNERGLNGGGDHYDVRMEEIARDMKRFNVHKIWVESNFGDGLWTKSFLPILTRVWPPKQKDDASGTSVEETRVSGQKEQRIIDALEPALLNHRVVVDEQVARDPVLGYQLTHITRDRNALKHDDRIDVLGGAVEKLSDTLSQDVYAAAKAQREEELDVLLEDFVALAQAGGTRIRAKRRTLDDYREPDDLINVRL